MVGFDQSELGSGDPCCWINTRCQGLRVRNSMEFYGDQFEALDRDSHAWKQCVLSIVNVTSFVRTLCHCYALACCGLVYKMRIEPDVIRKKGENTICPRDQRTWIKGWQDLISLLWNGTRPFLRT